MLGKANHMNDSVEEGSEMEISETTLSVRRSSRAKTVKRVFEIETNGCSAENSTPTSGVKMKGGASTTTTTTTTTTDFVTPKSVKRTSNGEVQKRKIMAALHNLGNTCFLNSVVQVLYHTPQFLEKITFLGSEVKSAMLALDLFQQLNYDGLDVTSGFAWSLVSRLSELLKQMKQIDTDVAQGNLVRFPALRPYNLLETIEEINHDFEGNQQQDAHELLKCILMNIDEASNELNTSRSRMKLCVGNGSLDSNPQDVVKNLESSAKKLQTNVLLFEANNQYGFRATYSADLKNDLPSSWDNLKSEQENEGTSCKATERSNLSTSDILLDENWSAGRGIKRKHSRETESSDLGQFDCDSEDHVPFDDEISFKLKSVKLASDQHVASQVSLIRLSPASESRSQNQLAQNCCIRLHRLDSPLGMQHANIATRAVSNLVTELFQGLMSLKTKCLNCLKETERKEEFQDISLPVRKPSAADSSNISDADTDSENKRVTVLQLILSILNEVEQLDGENCYYCDSCQHLVTAERRLCYDLLPNILTIHLKRFAMNSSSSFMKTFDRVDIPLELPCLEGNCRNRDSPCHRYSLYGIVCHAGKSLVSGHYTSYVRVHPRSKQDTWCNASSQSCDSGPLNVFSPDDHAVINKMSGDKQWACDTSLDTLEQAYDSFSYVGSQSAKGLGFTNANVTMQDISLFTTPSSSSESRNLVTPDSVNCSKDPAGLGGCNSGRPRKRKKRHRIQKDNGTESEVYRKIDACAETDQTFGSGDDSSWYKCNDDVITEMTKQQLAGLLKSSGNVTPYMLFYHKVSLPTH